MQQNQDFIDYKREIYSLKPILENLNITSSNIKRIMHILSFNRFENVTSRSIVNMKQEQEELVVFLNSLKSFKNFPIGVLENDNKDQKIMEDYTLFNANHVPVAAPNDIYKYYRFIYEHGEILYADTDNLLIYPIVEALIYSKNEHIQKLIVNKYAKSFIEHSFSNASKEYKNLNKQEIEARVRKNLDTLNPYLDNYYKTPNPNDSMEVNIDPEEVSLTRGNITEYLPHFYATSKYFLLPRKIDPNVLNIAKDYIDKIAEFNNKSKLQYVNKSITIMDCTENLLSRIFNHLWVVKKHQEAAIKWQTNEGVDFYNYIVTSLPDRATKKRLGNSKKEKPLISTSFSEETNIEIECDLKDFVDKTGITKEIVKEYIKDLSGEAEFHPFFNSNGLKEQSQEIYLLQSKGSIKFGINYHYDENEKVANKKELDSFYALVVFEKLVDLLEKYKQRKNGQHRVDMTGLFPIVNIDSIKQEVRSKLLFEQFEVIEKEQLTKIKKKI